MRGPTRIVLLPRGSISRDSRKPLTTAEHNGYLMSREPGKLIWEVSIVEVFGIS
jgi:hypothetical protein